MNLNFQILLICSSLSAKGIGELSLYGLTKSRKQIADAKMNTVLYSPLCLYFSRSLAFIGAIYLKLFFYT